MTIPVTTTIDVKRVLLLGASGFLGTHLLDALVRAKVHVRVLDRSLQRVSCGVRSEMTDIVFGDFVTGEGLAGALEGVDLVYHLISTTVPSSSNLDPLADVQSNLIGTLRLLEMMRDSGVARIVYVSSGGTVYGNPSMVPVPETHPLQPLCSYGVVKVAVENYLHMHSELYGLIANVLRVSNPYGMHQHHIGVQGVIPTFFKKIADGLPIEIWGDGSVVRDYIYISDVVSALLLAGDSKDSGTYNIGSGVGHSVNDVLEIIQRQMSRKTEVRYSENRKFDVEKIFLDVKKARNELGWQPRVSLEDGCAAYWKALQAKIVNDDSAQSGVVRL